jgi:hypothetical protein
MSTGSLFYLNHIVGHFHWLATIQNMADLAAHPYEPHRSLLAIQVPTGSH